MKPVYAISLIAFAFFLGRWSKQEPELPHQATHPPITIPDKTPTETGLAKAEPSVAVAASPPPSTQSQINHEPELERMDAQKQLQDLEQQLYRAHENTSLQLHILDQMKEIDPVSKVYHESYVDVLSLQGDWDQVYEQADTCLQNHPKSIRCARHLASSSVATQPFDEMIAATDRCLSIHKGDPACLQSRGHAFMSRGDLQQAIQTFTEALKTESWPKNHGLLQAGLAAAFLAAGERQQARLMFEEACQLGAEHACESLSNF